MLSKFWDKYGKTILIVSIIMFTLLLMKNSVTKRVPVHKAPGLMSMTTARPDLPKSAGETECRRVLEDIFKKEFRSVRPAFLNNPVTSTKTASYNMELDCYNPELGIAVEYNGRQHYEHVPFFHKTRDAFHNQKYRDELKRIMCKRVGVTLIEVPYTVSVPDIRRYLINELKNSRAM